MRHNNAGAVFVGLSLVWLGALLSAQSPSTVSDRVIAALPVQEANWELDQGKLVIRDKEFVQIWRNRAERIDITYEELASEAAATEWLDSRPMRVSSGGGKPLANVGDAALMWSRVTVSGGATIYFRKGKATVRVSAPYEALAIRAAQLVAAQIYP